MNDKIDEYYPSGKLKSTVPSKNGVPHGHNKIYFESGELMYEGEFENNNQEGLWKLYYINGVIQRENIFKNHIKISQKEFYPCSKIEFEGKYDENLDKTGKWYYYFKNGLLKKEEVFNKNISESLKEWDEDGLLKLEEKQTKNDTQNNVRYGVRQRYFKNGKLMSEVKLKDTNFGFFEHGLFREYFEENLLKCEGEFEKSGKTGKWISYFQSGKIKKEEIFNYDICESLKEWDENENLIKENMLQNGDTRTILTHEIMTKGSFNFLKLKDGNEINVFGQCHTLVEMEEYYEDGEWIEEDRNEIDDFYLTGYEEGYLFEVEDICKFFEVDDYGEWDFNGSSSDWCGINDDDDYEIRQKKWDDYKSKFPRVTSKKQFEF